MKGSSLIILLIVIAAILAVVYLLSKILPLYILSQKKKEQPNFNVELEYQNPFRENVQEGYINPFENLK